MDVFRSSTRFVQSFFVSMLCYTPLLVFCCVPLEYPVAYAEFISPEKVNVHTENYSPQFLDIPQGTFLYSIHWQGIPVAEAQVSIAQRTGANRKNWEVKIKARSSSVVSLFYTLDFFGHAIFDGSNLRPLYFSTEQTENGRQSGRKIKFNSDGTIQSVKSKKGKPSESLSFNPKNLLFDPISAVFYIRSLALKVGEPVIIDVYTSKHRYLVSFLPSGIERIVVAKQTYQAWNLIPSVTRLTDSEPEKRIRKLNVWLSNDDRRIILRLVSEVWIGKVTADLIEARILQ